MNKLSTQKISYLLLLAFAFILSTATFFLGRVSVKQTTRISSEQNTCLNQVNSLEDEVSRCIEDKVKAVSQSNEMYSFAKAGIASPLLENKSMNIIQYDYKRSQVQFTEISLGNNEGIVTWQPIKILHINTDNKEFFPVLTGYENFGIPTLLGTIMADWDTRESFTTQYDLTFVYESIPAGPRTNTPGIIAADTYISNSALGRPIYLRVLVPIVTMTPSASDISKAKTRAKEIAESINYKNTQ